MTRIFDFDYPEMSSNDLIRELVFVKTNQRLMPIGVLWFLISSIYLLILNLCAFSLVMTFDILYLTKFYTIGMGIIFVSRLLLGYVLEYID